MYLFIRQARGDAAEAVDLPGPIHLSGAERVVGRGLGERCKRRPCELCHERGRQHGERNERDRHSGVAQGLLHAVKMHPRYAAFHTGSPKLNCAPSLARLMAFTVLPCNSTMRFTMARPKPLPSESLERRPR